MIIFLIIFSSFFLNFECEECDICTVSKNYAECDAMYVCPQNVTTIYATCLLKKIKSTTRIKQVLIRGDCENIGRFKLLCRFPIDEVLLRKHHITWKCRTASGAKETSAESTGGSDLVQQAFAIALTVAGIVLLAILFKILKWLRRRCLSDLEFRSPVVRRRRARRHPLLSFNVTPSYRMNSTRRSSV